LVYAAGAEGLQHSRRMNDELIPPSGGPLEIRVDRPFAFAIQHTKSGACLFLGRVTDPR
jgi:serine protease inhibitor